MTPHSNARAWAQEPEQAGLALGSEGPAPQGRPASVALAVEVLNGPEQPRHW